MSLTKTKFCKGVQCPKMLWMDANKPEEFDESSVDEARFEVGNIVGVLALQYFGDVRGVKFQRDKNAMCAETERFLQSGAEFIAEASFSYDDNFCMVDVLKITPGGCEITEVKSATSIKPINIFDMAYQAYVLLSLGMKVQKVNIMLLNKEYVRGENLNVRELFVLTDCTDEVMGRVQEIPEKIEEIRRVLRASAEPDMNIGSRCDAPFTCGYKNWCYRNLSSPNIFDIGWRLFSSKKDEAYSRGVVSFEDVLSEVALNEKQLRQVHAQINDSPPYINRDALNAFLSQIRYPLYHMDFETFQQAVPQYRGLSPYTQIPFQYSVHIQSHQGAVPTHKEFLAKEGLDPRAALAQALCNDIPATACCIAYNMPFEKGVLRKLAEFCPHLSGHLMSIHDNMIDLAVPFQSGMYYTKEMGGSYSIKRVLPAIFPNDPALDYKSLTLIQHGGHAMAAFPALHEKTPDEIAELRTALLAYCKLDTFAMVKILDFLFEL